MLVGETNTIRMRPPELLFHRGQLQRRPDSITSVLLHFCRRRRARWPRHERSFLGNWRYCPAIAGGTQQRRQSGRTTQVGSFADPLDHPMTGPNPTPTRMDRGVRSRATRTSTRSCSWTKPPHALIAYSRRQRMESPSAPQRLTSTPVARERGIGAIPPIWES